MNEVETIEALAIPARTPAEQRQVVAECLRQIATASEVGDLDLGQLEKRHIERVLESEEGSVTRAARRLGITREGLYKKMKRFGIE